MRRIGTSLLGLAVVAVACEKEPTSAPLAAAAPSTPAAVVASSPSAPAPSSAAGWHVDVVSPGGVVVQNDTDAPVSVALEMPIEREEAGTFVPVNGMKMMTKCFEPAPASGCVTVPAHGTFSPLPWTGWFGCTQCGTCRANVPAGAGRYRVVAKECASGARRESAVMEIVGDGRFAHTVHVYAPKGDPSSIIIDNESDKAESFQTSVAVMRSNAQGATEEVPNAGMALTSTCAPLPACVTVGAHATLHTLAYRPGCALCAKCAAANAAPGEYTMRVSVCDPSKPLYNDVYGASFYTASFVVDAAGRATQR